MTEVAASHEYRFPDKLWHDLLKQRARELEVSLNWDVIEQGDHWLGVERMLIEKEYELGEPARHDAKDREGLHVEDCPMTNYDVEARLDCVCRYYPSEQRTALEGGE
jgi:hypothetical protein